ARATGIKLRGFHSKRSSSTASSTAATGEANVADMPPAAPATSRVFRSAAVIRKSCATIEPNAPPVMMIGPSAPKGPPEPIEIARIEIGMTRPVVVKSPSWAGAPSPSGGPIARDRLPRAPAAGASQSVASSPYLDSVIQPSPVDTSAPSVAGGPDVGHEGPGEPPDRGAHRRELGEMVQRELAEHRLSPRREFDEDLASVDECPAPPHEPPLRQAVDQLDGAVVL